MIALKCPDCGKPIFGRTDRRILTRLTESVDPISVSDLFEGINVAAHGRQVVLHRIRTKIARQGYRLANVAKHPNPARYRLQPLEK